jgi:hypothetical protein
MIRSGIRLCSPYKSKSKGMTIGIFYKHGMEKQKFKMFGLNALMGF